MVYSEVPLTRKQWDYTVFTVTWNVLWTTDSIINKPMVPSVNENKHEICWKADVRRNNNQRPPQALWYFGHTSSPWVHETTYGTISRVSRKALFPQHLHTWYRMFLRLRSRPRHTLLRHVCSRHWCRASPPRGLGLEDLKHAAIIQKENKYSKIKTVSPYPSTEVSHGVKWRDSGNGYLKSTAAVLEPPRPQQRVASRTWSDGWCRTNGWMNEPLVFKTTSYLLTRSTPQTLWWPCEPVFTGWENTEN